MRKAVVAVFTMVVLASLLLAGCGGSGASAQEILENSEKAMQDIQSFKMKMSVSGLAAGEGMDEGMDESIEIIASRSETNPDQFNMQLVMDSGGESDSYVVDGVEYTLIDGEWYKSEIDEPITMTEFDEIFAMAANATVESETNDAWTLKYEGDQEMINELIGTGMEAQGEEMDEAMKELTKDFELGGTLTIEKSTYYLTSYSMQMKGSGGMLGSIDMTTSFELSDIDGDLEVELPDAAKNAKDMPADMEMEMMEEELPL